MEDDMPPRKVREPEVMLEHELGQKLYYLCIASRMLATRTNLDDAELVTAFAQTVTPMYKSGYVIDGGSRIRASIDNPAVLQLTKQISRDSGVRQILENRFKGSKFTAF